MRDVQYFYVYLRIMSADHWDALRIAVALHLAERKRA